MEKLEEASKLASELKIERPYSLPGILLGTSAFTANGWQGSFYLAGMKPADYLKFYGTQFMAHFLPRRLRSGTRRRRLILSSPRRFHSYVALRIMWQHDRKGRVSDLFWTL